MPKFRLAIANVVEIQIEIVISTPGKKTIKHKPTLICNRLTQDEIDEILAPVSGEKNALKVFMTAVTTGWRDQELVLDDSTEQPADFSPEALDVLLNVRGVDVLAFNKYLADVGARAKNS